MNELKKNLFNTSKINNKNKFLKIRSDYTSEEEKKRNLKSRKLVKYIKPTKKDVIEIFGFLLSENIKIENININFELNWNLSKRENCIIYYLNSSYIFIFSFGVVIFWNLKEVESKLYLNKITPFLEKPYPQNEIEKDYMFYYNDFFEYSKIEENTIFLVSSDLDEKYTHSYALSQSLKLEVYENKIEKDFQNANQIPNILAEKGEINLSKNQIYKMMGNLFLLRNNVNFVSGVIDSPEYFWDKENLEKIFDLSRDYYDIDDRINILNDRMNLIKELYELLNDDLHNKHTTFLEWIVIILIIIEVVIELVWNIIIKDIFKIYK